MRFAVISDIQGNLIGLESVLAEIDGLDEPVDRVVCAGDVVGLGPQPNEVLQLLRERSIETVRGNYDDAVAFDRASSGVDFPTREFERADFEAIRWTRAVLSTENLEYLRELPRDVRLIPLTRGTGVRRNDVKRSRNEYGRTLVAKGVLGGLYRQRAPRVRRILVVHGSTRALNERITEDAANTILRTIAQAASADMLISGHACQSFQRAAVDMMFVGVGPVSGPFASKGQSEYVIVDLREGAEIEFGAVRYDAHAHAQEVVARGLPPLLAHGLQIQG